MTTSSDQQPEGKQGNLEHEKFKLEKKRLRLEWFKAWTGVPLIAAIVTGLLAYWGQVQKARDDFELKAAEIVMSAITPYGAANKADALKKIFPNRLSSDFGEAFDPTNMSVHAPVKFNTVDKAELLKLLADKSKDTREIVEFAKALFPQDTTVNTLEIDSLPANKANSADARNSAAD
jgi:hypothetical protein